MLDFYQSICYYFSNMKEKKINWLSRRLSEVGKTKKELAAVLDVFPTKLSEYEYGIWNFKISHVNKVAEFLNFDRTAFLDFLSGDITEQELFNTPKNESASGYDRQIMAEILTDIENWLDEHDREMKPEIKIQLLFVLYDKVYGIPKREERKAQIIALTDTVFQIKVA